MASGRLSKAKRGKKRWIGLKVPQELNSREALSAYLKEILEVEGRWRLFDLCQCNEGLRAVIRVDLTDYPSVRSRLCEGEVVSLSSSGKIRLLRQRLGISPRKRNRVR